MNNTKDALLHIFNMRNLGDATVLCSLVQTLLGRTAKAKDYCVCSFTTLVANGI